MRTITLLILLASGLLLEPSQAETVCGLEKKQCEKKCKDKKGDEKKACLDKCEEADTQCENLVS